MKTENQIFEVEIIASLIGFAGIMRHCIYSMYSTCCIGHAMLKVGLPFHLVNW